MNIQGLKLSSYVLNVYVIKGVFGKVYVKSLLTNIVSKHNLRDSV